MASPSENPRDRPHRARRANRPSSTDLTKTPLAAARRQKWIDQSQSVNLFLANPYMQGASARSNLNRTYCRA